MMHIGMNIEPMLTSLQAVILFSNFLSLFTQMLNNYESDER